MRFKVGDRVVMARSNGFYASVNRKEGTVLSSYLDGEDEFTCVIYDNGEKRTSYSDRLDAVDNVSNVPEDWS